MKAIFEQVSKRLHYLPPEESYTIIDGLVSKPLTYTIKQDISFADETIRLVMVVGDTSGSVYHFAVKAL